MLAQVIFTKGSEVPALSIPLMFRASMIVTPTRYSFFSILIISGGMFKIKIIQKFPERSALMNYSVTRIKDTQIPEPTAPTPSFHVGSSTWYHFFLMFFISSKSD